MESLDCELSENIYFYVCQMFIIKSMLRRNKIDAFFSIFCVKHFFGPICDLWPITFKKLQTCLKDELDQIIVDSSIGEIIVRDLKIDARRV